MSQFIESWSKTTKAIYNGVLLYYLKQALIPVKQLIMWVTALLLLSCGGGSGNGNVEDNDKDVLIPVAAVGNTYMYVNNQTEAMKPEVIIPETSAFYGDYAVVGKEKKGFIDRNGKLIIPMQYAEATIFSDGLAFVKETSNSTVVAIDTKGKEVFQLPEATNARRFSEGLAAFKDKKNGLWGFVDKTGKVVIEAQYKEAGDFACGLAAVGSRNAYGFINSKGKVVVEPQFNDIAFSMMRELRNKKFTAEGYCVVGICEKRNGTFGVINTKGQFVIPLRECDDMVADKGGFIVYFEKYANAQQVIYIDVKGKTVLEGFSELYPFNGGKYTIAMPLKRNDYVIIDREGKTVSKITFSPVSFFTSFIDGMAVAQNAGGYAGSGQTIINEKGENITGVDKVFVADDYLYSEHNYFRLNNY